MQIDEKLGSFYLGLTANANNDNPDWVLYDAKDLTTHAVIIGMTGSGKTGLGTCLIEEALLDGIPVIAIDPKGDMGNLLLNFPELDPAQFAPYINADEAEQAGLSVAELAQQKATLWKNGLHKTHQSQQRLQSLHDAVDRQLFTPGATYGRPISLLKSLRAPNAALVADNDLYRQRISAATTGILSLLGVENDPLSREHLFINTALAFYWDKGQDIAISDLIATIQNPPFERIGVMAVETIYPAKARLKLAIQLNNLLASPEFEAWMQGAPLNAEHLFFSDKGKPQLSVMNIAHLSKEMQIFFVTMLLNEILAWMRTQSGTSSLRAVLYIDELFGYMPPVGNPATKALLLTLLKQARAYGLGLVLSTQNPVDLDYKGLSNAGTWFIGKLQTEQDRNRVMTGLLSASENGFDKKELNAAFDQMGNRQFLLHNIHENAPVIMTTRWAMSYLSGPLSRQQIASLCKAEPPTTTAQNPAQVTKTAHPKDDVMAVKYVNLPTGVQQYQLPATQVVTDTSRLVYQPALMGLLDIHYEDRKSGTRFSRKKAFVCSFSAGAVPISWQNAREVFADRPELLGLIDSQQPDGAQLIEPPVVATQDDFYHDWEKALLLWVRQHCPLNLLSQQHLNLYSQPNESESQFRQRIAINLREARDNAVDELREQINKKLSTLEAKLQRAEIKVKKEGEQASGKTMDALIGAGTAIFSAFFSRKTVSVTNARRLGSALRKAKGAFAEHDDVGLAKQQVATIQTSIDALSKQFEEAQQAIVRRFDSNQTTVTTHQLYPKTTATQTLAFGIAWQPGVIVDGVWQAV